MRFRLYKRIIKTAADDTRKYCYQCEKVHDWAVVYELFDGRIVGSETKEMAFVNLAYIVLRNRRSKASRVEFLRTFEVKNGKAAKDRLRGEMLKIWKHRQQLSTNTK